MRRCLCLLFVMLGLGGLARAAAPAPAWPDFSTAGFFAVPDSPRQVYDFDPGWRFLKGDAPGAEAPAFDDSAWQKVNLPHGLEIEPENASGMRNYQGPAWYRKHFAGLPAALGGRLVLYFEAVMGKCTVWINGQKVAEHFGGYLPFAIDTTGVLTPNGGDNVIAVRADNSDDPLYPPGKPQRDLDFTYMGGIYRDVFLIHTEDVRVTFPELSETVAGGGVFVATKALDDTGASLEIRTELENKTASPTTVMLRTVLEDQDHHDLQKQEQAVSLAPGQAQQLAQTLTVAQPHLWSPNDPYLHFIRTEVVRNGAVVDSLRTRFGIRTLELKEKEGLYLNHHPLGYKMVGANRHQDYVYVGNALPKSGQWRDAKLLREGGCTFIRAAHYPMSPAFLDACDALGLFVTDASPGWQFHPQDPAHSQIFDERLLSDTRNMVRRDRNRPAMLFWETTLNETSMPEGLPARMSQAAHDEFPFPSFYTTADPADARAGGMNATYYNPNWDKPLPNPDTPSYQREIGDWVDNFSNHNSPVRVNREWGERALDLQASLRADMLNDIYIRPPQMMGAALWAGIDHQRGYNPDPFWGGLLDVYRIPRYSYFLFRSQYDPDLKVPGISTGPMVYISHELTYISDRDVVIYTNCQQVHLTWMGRDLGTRGPDPGAHEPHPPIIFKNAFDIHPISGELYKQHRLEMVADGLINGQVVCHTVKEYPQRTAGLHLVVDDQGVPLQADGSDFVPVRAFVVDQYGTPKVLESAYVTFHVDGPGEIIGGEANHGNPMKTEFGEATTLVRAGLTPGMLHITATSDGLKSDSVNLTTVAPRWPLDPAPAAAGP